MLDQAAAERGRTAGGVQVLPHYLTIAARNLGRNKIDASVGILGLAFGLACFLGTHVFTTYVSSADRSFPHVDRIYAIYTSFDVRAMNLAVPLSAGASPLLADALRAEFPELEVVARSRTDARAVVGVGAEDTFRKVRYVEPDFLEIFDLPLVAGSRRQAVARSRSALLTQRTARALFGDADAVGRTLHLRGVGDVEVAGVLGELAEPSQFGRSMTSDDPVEIFVVTQVPEDISGPQPEGIPENLRWFLSSYVDTYVLLPERGFTAAALNARLPAFAARHVHIDNTKLAFEARPVTDLFRDDVNDILGPLEFSLTRLLVGLGGLVLAIACLNYVNLATARSLTRAKEVGLRKVLGARRGQVMLQYLCESILAAALAMPLALLVLQLGITALDRATGLSLDPPWGAGVGFWTFVVALTLATGAASAAYPAVVLSRVKPMTALRAGAVRAGPKHVRALLIGLQFAAASLLLIGVIVVTLQNAELERSAVGAGPDPVVVIPIRLQDAGVDADVFRSRLEASPSIRAVTGASAPPWASQAGGSGYARTPGNLSSIQFIQEQAVGFGYFAALGTRLLAGRTFSADRDDARDTEASSNIIIDRLTAEQFGWSSPADALGETLYAASSTMFGGDYSPRKIIGVVEHAPPRTLGWGSRAFIYSLDRDGISFPILQIARDDVAGALERLDGVWRDLAPAYPLEREFMDERFERAYRLFEHLNVALTTLAGLAFAIAVTGLVGMTVFIAGRRRHEMGVRKVLGASFGRLLRAMLADYLRPVLAANLLAWPLGYLAAQAYVSLFIHPLRLTPVPFLLSFGGTVVISAAVVARQAVRSARVAPAAVLRYE